MTGRHSVRMKTKSEGQNMANNSEFQKLMRRARWDRLFGALIVLVLLIILLTCIFKSCGKDAAETGGDTSTIAPVETEPTTEPAKVDNSMAVFLSPSTQEDNVYKCDDTVTEASAMFDLTRSVKALLEADGYTVYVCEEDDNVKAKVTKGNELKCGAYVALHSNAGGESGSDEGTECYYNSAVPGSRELAENVYNRVAELTPTEDRGLKDETQRELYEILNNQNPCCLLEVEFHDTETHSQWILDNKEEIAKSIKDGIVAFLNASAPAETRNEDDLPTDSTTDDSVADDGAVDDSIAE